MRVYAKLCQSCLAFCSSMDCSLPDSSVPGFLKPRILEWFTMPFSRGIFWTQGSNSHLYVSCIGTRHLGSPIYVCVHAQSLTSVWLLVTLSTVASQAPLSMGFSYARILEWFGTSSSREFPNPGIKPASPVSPAL